MSKPRELAKATLPRPIREWVVERRERRASVRGHLELYGPAKAIDPHAVQPLREASRDTLTDAEALAALLPELGLNDEAMEYCPESLLPYAGKGLLHWQYPIQFAPYLVELSRHPISSYLEIGTRHGGTFVVTVEYLARFRTVTKAIGVDIQPAEGLEAYVAGNEVAETVVADSRSSQFRSLVRRKGPFDLALIDGDHSEEGVRADYELLRDHANIIVLHDIVNGVVPGVRAVWQEVRQDGRFRCLEFTEQYADVRERSGIELLGLGMAINREWEERRA